MLNSVQCDDGSISGSNICRYQLNGLSTRSKLIFCLISTNTEALNLIATLTKNAKPEMEFEDIPQSSHKNLKVILFQHNCYSLKNHI